MKFLANENIPAPSVQLLRQAGFEVAYIADEVSGIDDAAVLQLACDEQRIILTFDRDYGELIFKLHYPSPAGIIYLRFEPEFSTHPGEVLLKLLKNMSIHWLHHFSVVEDEYHIRQRLLPKVSL